MKKIFRKIVIVVPVLIISVCLMQTKLHAQSTIQWQKCLGGTEDDWCTSIDQTIDGGYVVAGYTNSLDGDITGHHSDYYFDYWVVKLDANGNIKWQKSLGGNDDDKANCVKKTSDGGCIIVGMANSTNGDVTGNHGGRDCWVVKLDTAGNIQWQKCLGGSDWDEGNSVQQTTDGGYVVAGWSASYDGDVTGNHGDADYWVVKLTGSGTIDWQKSLGGSVGDVATSIQQTSDLGYIVAGISASGDGDVTGCHTGSFYDYWIVKLSETGGIQWEKCYGGTNDDEAKSICQTTNGYIVAGYSYSNSGDVTGNHNGNGGDLGYSDVWLLNVNSIGTKQWQKCLGGSYNDRAYSVKQTIDGGYIIAATTESNDSDVTSNIVGGEQYWIIKLDASGNIQQQKCLGGNGLENVADIIQTTDGGYAIAGYTSSTSGDVSGNHGSFDYWVVKLSAGMGIGEDDYSNSVMVYPNPVKDQLHIETSQKARIEIMSIQGKTIRTIDNLNKSLTVETGQLPDGIYVIRVKTDKGVVIKKFIKE